MPAEVRCKSGVVVPRPLRWPQRLGAWLAYVCIRLVAATLRCRWELHPDFEQHRGSVIFTIWHNRLSLCLLIFEHLQRRSSAPRPLAAIVSASRDGGIVARVLEHFRVQPVRGSSSRRGPQALLELTTWAERGYDLALTPDGPRGPCYVVQPGAVALAQLTGLPLVPASWQVNWKLRARSWDRFQIPLPFARCTFKLGAPLHVPRTATDDEREVLRAELERRLRELTVDE